MHSALCLTFYTAGFGLLLLSAWSIQTAVRKAPLGYGGLTLLYLVLFAMLMVTCGEVGCSAQTPRGLCYALLALALTTAVLLIFNLRRSLAAWREGNWRWVSFQLVTLGFSLLILTQAWEQLC